MGKIICLEGTDRSGKSTIAEHYKQLGFEVIHFSAPDKKYFKSDYCGPSYAEDQLDLIATFHDKDVILDRTPHLGELVWPTIYNRKPALDQVDIEYIHEMLSKMGAQFWILHDDDITAHWQRCVNNKENLTRIQFEQARHIYTQIAHELEIPMISMPKYMQSIGKQDTKEVAENVAIDDSESTVCIKDAQVSISPELFKKTEPPPILDLESPLGRLDYANKLNKVLSKRIIRTTDPVSDIIESELREFLETKIAALLGDSVRHNGFTQDEIQILKQFCKQWTSKLNK